MTRTAVATSLLLAALTGCGGASGSSGQTAAASTAAPAPAPSPAPGGQPPAGPTGELVGSYAGRAYRLFVPDGVAGPLPLVVAFHGAGDDSGNFFATLKVGGWLAAAQQAGVAIVVPDTRSPYGTFPVWTGDPLRDLPDMRAELAEVLALVDRDVAPRYPVQASSIHALGFSDGGLFVGAVGLPEARFATCTIFGYGWGPGSIAPVSERRPAHMACGSGDRFYGAATQTRDYLSGQGHEVRWEGPAAGHSLLQLSQAVPPGSSLAWMLARPLGGAAPTPAPAPAPAPTAPTGLVRRQITVPAQGSLPSFTVETTLYVPTGYDPARGAPILYAANVGLGPWQALAEAEGIVVVDFRDHDRNGGFRYDTDVALLSATIQDVEGAYRLEPGRRYLYGFSAGAHWGYTIALANANAFAALGVSAGSMSSAIQMGVWPSQVARALPVVIRHGVSDAVVPVAAARADRDRLRAAGLPVDYAEFAGGHEVRAQEVAAIWAAMASRRAP